MATVWNSLTHGVAPATTTQNAATKQRSVGFLGHIFDVLAWVGERRARSHAMRELERMDERDLRDLRITPYDFDEISKGTFRR